MKDPTALKAWIRLLKVYNLIIRRSREHLSKYCTLPQFDILAQLLREPKGTTPLELSRRLLVTAGNITGIINRMEAAGTVKRKREPKDRRVVRIHLTAKGKELARTVIPKHAADIEESFHALNIQEIIALGSLLEKLSAGLEKEQS